MLIDANALAGDSRIDCDVCIAGSGPAGITLANELAGSPIQVCVIEGGGLPDGTPVRASIVAEQVGLPVDMVKFRQYMFGGASNLWGGVRRRWVRLRPMDPIDFEERPWVTNSGWPIKYHDLVPYFRRAADIMKVPCFGNFDAAAFQDRLVPEFHDEEVHTALFQVVQATRFGEVYADPLANARNVRVYLHARVVEIEEHPTSPVVRCLHFVTPGGSRHRVSAKHFVLACGGLENPRLLLTSNRKAAAGVGNEHDLVGRYYMQHPKGMHGIALLNKKSLRSPLYTRRCRADRIMILAGLSFSEEFQRKEKVLNHCIMFGPMLSLSESHASAAYRALLRAWHSPNGSAGRYSEFFGATASAAAVLGRAIKDFRVDRLFVVANHMEQIPRPDSRLDLSRQRDRSGVQQLRTDWRINGVEKESLRRLHELVGGKLARDGAGRLESELDPLGIWPISQDSGHHLGTTRMHGDPRRGVTDAHCRVHGVRNLYISGGSLFPTCGHANPTFTIVALAVRLADHLKNLYESTGSAAARTNYQSVLQS